MNHTVHGSAVGNKVKIECITPVYSTLTLKVNTMKTFKLTAVGSIKSTLAGIVEAKKNVTISALFHGLVSSNTSFATDMKREDAADFDTVLRQLLPIQWNKDAGQYQFSDKKCFKSAEKLGLTLEHFRAEFKAGDTAKRAELVQQFYEVCSAYYDVNAAAKKADDLDADAQRLQALSRVKAGIKAAKESGITDTELLDLLVGMGVKVQEYVPALERTKVAA